MKLTSYTLHQVKEEVMDELFRIWQTSNLDDWTNADMRDLHILYHNLFKDKE